MPKRSFRPPRIAPLQHIVAETITDPAEIAALDLAHQRHKRAAAKQDEAPKRRQRHKPTGRGPKGKL
jgi:hypothetical protein